MGLIYKLAADVVVVIHFVWIVFLIGGAVIGRRVRWVKWLHLGALMYSVPLQIFSWTCPLTDLEFWLRSRGGSGQHYSGSFIVHYMEELVYLEIPRSLLLVLTGIVIGISSLVYYQARPKTR